MIRLKYKGTDSRLEFGHVYDCTLMREKRPNGNVYVSVHVSLHGRIYKQYSAAGFSNEWEEELSDRVREKAKA